MNSVEICFEIEAIEAKADDNPLTGEFQAVLDRFGNDWDFVDGNEWFRQGQIAYSLFKNGLIERRETPLGIRRQFNYSFGKGYQYRRPQ